LDNRETPGRPKRELTTSAAVALVASASYVALGLGLVRGLLVASILSPTSRGIVQIAFLFGQYLGYSHIGITHGLTKRIPLLLGQGGEKQADHLERTGITSVFVLTVLAAGVMWAYAGLAPGVGTMTRFALGIAGFHLLLGQLVGIYRIVLRSHHEFGLMSRSIVIEAIVLVALVVAGAQLLDAPGAVLGWALGTAIVCLHLLSFGVLPGRPTIDRRATLGLAKVGLPVLGVGLTDIFLRTADNLVVAKMLGAQALGYYGQAWQLATYLFNVPAAAGSVIMPKILRAHGEGGTGAMKRSVLDMTSAFAILMPPLAGAAAIGGPILVRLILPRYIPCIGALQVFMISVVFLAVPLALRTALIAKNREVEIMIWQGLGGLLIGGAVALLSQRTAHLFAAPPPVDAEGTAALLIRQQTALTQLALAGACGLFLTGLAITVRGLQALELAPGQVARHLLGWAIPLAYCVLLLWGLKTLLPRWLGLTSPLVSDAVSLPIFIVLGAPLAWVAERTTGIIRKARAGGGGPPPPSEETPDSLPSGGADSRL